MTHLSRPSRATRLAQLLAALCAVLILAGCTSGVVVIRDNAEGNGGGAGGGLNTAAVPAEFVGPLTEFGSMCEGISPPLLAAQIKAESGFRKGAVSPAGAMGYTQFMPGTWAAYGDGGDPNNPRDAVKAQAKYDCAMLKIAADRGCTGEAAVKVMLAMYNAGPGGVSGCEVPANGETEIYVPRILAYVEEFTAADGGLTGNAETGSPRGPFRYDQSKTPGQNVVLAAMSQIGLPYAWGGGSLTGPSKGITDGGTADSFGDYNKIGFDCSGLSRYAIYQGSRGKIEIGRHTSAQEAGGTPVPLDQLQAGDLILWPGHVAIARGDGKTMVEAQQSGTLIKVSPLRPGGVGRRYVGAGTNAGHQDAA
ncbi:NlpC/P60 family protein [Gordonia sp. NPDC058843]|uniref:C40 family peptidase n=1 Tax=Gordonia sp. NPDC058843 TaxID=3346648 RepID=UPI0036923326